MSAGTDNEEVLLAVDPSLRGTGYAVVRVGVRPTCLEYGVLKLGPKLSVPGCLLEIFQSMEGLIGRHAPTVLVMESTIYVQSHRTAIVLGSARGAILLAAARHGLAIEEYAPRRVKQAVVGTGAAQKSQVAFMIRALFQLRETPPPDAADALAIASTYLQDATRRRLHRRR
jgi:crossover junction endodeoxyribonuclease RuvC